MFVNESLSISRKEELFDQLLGGLTLKKIVSEAEAEKADLAKNSLSEFVRQAWHVIEPATLYLHNWHIEAICEHLEAVTRGEIKRLLINMPPRHMKSIIVSVCWPCWEWIENPARRWLFSSYAQSLSTRDSLKCRRLIQSPWYQKNWGETFKLTSDQNAKTRFENDKTGYRIATSVGGVGTGEGGDRIVCDDPHNVKEAESEAVRESTLEWWDQVMSTRANDPKTAAVVIVMQRVHEADLSGHVLDQGGYDHLCLPAEYEGKKHYTSLGWEDPREHEKELLWPERFNRASIDDLKIRLGSRAAAGQLQQTPAPSEGGIWKREWFNYLRAIPSYKQIVQSWDTAFKKGEENAYTVGTTWAEFQKGYCLIDLFRERVEYPDLKRAIVSYANKWKPRAVLVEDKASGISVCQDLKRETRLPIIQVKANKDDKLVRAGLVAPLIEAGNVYLLENASWLADFLHECTFFPNSRFADQVDSTSQLLDYFQSQKGRVISGGRVITSRR